MAAPVLITGCSSGIGRAIALATLKAGLPPGRPPVTHRPSPTWPKRAPKYSRSTSPTKHPDRPPSNGSKPSTAPWAR